MANGTINLSSTRESLEGRIVWSSTSNGSTANSSNVSADLQVRRNDGYTTTGTWEGRFYVGSNTQDYTYYGSISSSWVTVKSINNVTVNHNNDGSGSCLIGGWCNGPTGTSMSGHYVEGAQTVVLDKIARKSSVTCADGNIGSSTTININRANSSFKHTITYSFGSSSPVTGTIATKTTETSLGWTIPDTFYAKIPNAQSGQGTITCETFDGNTSLGTTTTTFNAFVVNSNPTITATIVDSNSTTIALTGDSNKIVKYFSTANVTAIATAQNSATISSVQIKCRDGKTLTTTTGTIANVESNIFDLFCIDSRGFAGTDTVEKTLVDYVRLAITSLSVERLSSTSTTASVLLQGNYFNASFGSVSNTLTLRYRYKLTTATDYSGWATLTATKSGNTFSYSGNLSITLDADKDYDIQFQVVDKLMNPTYKRQVLKGVPLEDRWKNNVKVNGHFHCDDINAKDIYTTGGTNYYHKISGTPTANRTITLPNLTGTAVVKQSSAISTETNGWYKVDMGAYNMYFKNGNIASATYNALSWGTATAIPLPSGISFNSAKMAITANACGEDRAIVCSPLVANGSANLNIGFYNAYSGNVTTTIYYNAVLYDFS